MTWFPSRLRYLQSRLAKSVDALREAVGGPPPSGPMDYLPGYSVYRVCVALADGEEVSALEAALAAADLATVAVPVAKGGVTLVKGGVKAAGKKAAEQAARKAVVEGAEAAVKARLRGQAARAGAVVANRAAVWAAAKDLVRRSMVVVRDVLTARPIVAARLGEVDITAAVRFAYQHARVGRETFRRLTGLEARLFMRSDARLVPRVHLQLKGEAARDWVLAYLAGLLEPYAIEGEQPAGGAAGVILAPRSVPTPPRLPAGRRVDPRARAAGTLWLAAAANLLPAAASPDR